MKIIVVGVGALGSHLVLAIRNLTAKVTVIDFDRVESKNVMSQFHTKLGVGRNKTLALQQAMQGMFGTKIDIVPHRLTADNVEQLLGGADLVVDCLDNGASRLLVQGFVRTKDIPCLHGAVDDAGTCGRVVWDERFEVDVGTAVGQPTCEGGEHLPFICTVSAFLAVAVRRFVEQNQRVGYEINPGGVIRT